MSRPTAASFSALLGLDGAEERFEFAVELVEVLAPHIVDDPADHPWADWIHAEAHENGLMPGSPNRWSAGRDSQDWVPLRCDLVAEVKYEATLNGRFRGTTRFVRWRPDRDPASCNYDQLEVPVPVGLHEVLGARG